MDLKHSIIKKTWSRFFGYQRVNELADCPDLGIQGVLRQAVLSDNSRTITKDKQ
jgi:hypothetical protein